MILCKLYREVKIDPIPVLTPVPAPVPAREVYRVIDIALEATPVVILFPALAPDPILVRVVHNVMVIEDVMEIIPTPIIALVLALILALVEMIVDTIDAIVLMVIIVTIVVIREMVVGKIEMYVYLLEMSFRETVWDIIQTVCVRVQIHHW